MSAHMREMTSPMIKVKREDDGNDQRIRVRFKVLGSKFGPVEVVLYEYEAEELATDILEVLGCLKEHE